MAIAVRRKRAEPGATVGGEVGPIVVVGIDVVGMVVGGAVVDTGDVLVVCDAVVEVAAGSVVVSLLVSPQAAATRTRAAPMITSRFIATPFRGARALCFNGKPTAPGTSRGLGPMAI